MPRPVFFYAAWPLGYHNLEAERKAYALAEAGYAVTYVTGIGIRNPGLSSLAKLSDRSARAVSRVGASPTAAAMTPQHGDLSQGAILVAPPRQYPLMRSVNRWWLKRQLTRQISPWSDTLAWIRWPTPELVDALERLRPARIVYEAVDAYDATPGIIGRWKPIFAAADRLLTRQADLVVVPGELLAERYRRMGAEVRVVPHGVDLVPWRGLPAPGRPTVVGFLGTIDSRISVPVLRAIALAHPAWRIRLVGRVQDGFDPRLLTDLTNVTLEPPVPAARVPEVMASFDLGIMPYIEHPVTLHMTPVKNLEYLAAGVPAVARRLPALEPYADLLYFADSPAEFVAELERALAEQTPERAEARRRVAELHGWPRRLAQITAIADELTGGSGPPAARSEAEGSV